MVPEAADYHLEKNESYPIRQFSKKFTFYSGDHYTFISQMPITGDMARSNRQQGAYNSK